MSALELEFEVAALELATEFGTELETHRSGQATVQWAGPFTVAQAIREGARRYGLYVIYRSGQVVDSGKAEKQTLGARLAQHFEYASRHREPLTPYRIRLGFVRGRGQINLAEGTVTRSLVRAGGLPTSRRGAAGQKLRVPNTAPFRGGGGRGVQLIHRGKMPRELRGFTSSRKGANVQTIRRGQTFEYLPPHLLSKAAFEHELERAAATIASGASAAW